MLRRTATLMAVVALFAILQASAPASPAVRQGTPTSAGTLLTSGSPDTPARYVIYINWDAFRNDYFDWATRPGAMPPETGYLAAPTPLGLPSLSRFVANGVRFINAYTGIPSVTTAMQTSALAGAWPATHGNVGCYYDPLTNAAAKSGRPFYADTIVDAARRAGLVTASVQQFMLDGRADIYVQPGGRFERRVAETLKLFEAGLAGRAPMPQLVAIYADDLDAAGHNGIGYGTFPSFTEETWRKKMVAELVRMDTAFGTLIDGLMRLGIYENTAIILSSDHGMTPYWGATSLPQVVSEFAKAGLKAVLVETGDQAPDNADVVMATNGLSLQVHFRPGVSQATMAMLTASLSAQPYVGGVLTRDELTALGAHTLTGDMFIWPTPPHHFTSGNIRFGIRANHDTRHPSSVNVFMAMGGAGIKRGVEVSAPTPIIDIAPTISQLLGIAQPLSSEGRVLWEALSAPAQTPGTSAYSIQNE
ncbi:MAG: Type I phosphodiesterase / nucleotide pyrophosphatase [Firmicutes bacterium ADurb.Bin506]|nr:MAG: Type I phosphodiesterase / nucleotide pyrophosphatase [Firmicutes bacterium ADurb.Bin506]